MQKKKEVLLTISLLVSGREETTEKCLDSLIPIMQEIPSELILVDTGCNQEFVNMLRRYTNQIIPFTWCNDFSKARNVGLEHASGEWFLYLDDDEWFVEIDELIDFFKSGEYKEYHRANYIQRNFQDALLTYYSDSWASRMIRIEPDTHFESKIHEYLAPARGKCKNIKAVANHTGYIFQTEEDKIRHFERNSVLLLEMIKEEPKRLRWKVQLVQEYRGIKAWNDLYMFSKKCLEETKSLNSPMENRDIGTFYVGAVEGLLFLGDNDEAETIAGWGLADERMSMLCKSHLLLQLGVIYFRKGQFALAEKTLLKFLDNYQYMMEHEEELQEQQGVLLVEEAVDDISVKKAYSILCCCGLKQQSTANLKKYYDKLEWKKKVIYVCDDLPPVLMEAMSSMPIEEIFVSVWKDVWKSSELRNKFIKYNDELREQNPTAFYHMMRLASEADVEDEYTLYANILLAEKEKNVECLSRCLQTKTVSFLEQAMPGIFELMEYNELLEIEQLCEDVTPGVCSKLFAIWWQQEIVIRSDKLADFRKLRERIAKFSYMALDFLSEYFQPAVFEEYTEILPVYGQIAQLIVKALQFEETNPHQALEAYREVVNIDVAYADVISVYMRMFGDSLSSQNTQTELEELKENVLLKVYDQLKDHQYADASAILSELKKVVPNDLNIASMALEIRLLLLQSK